MQSSPLVPLVSNDLGIGRDKVYYDLYRFWQVVENDFNSAGLAMPSTFADHLHRVNSKDASVVLEEKKWFEDLVVFTYSLTENQFLNQGLSSRNDSAQRVAPKAVHHPNEIYPTYFMIGSGTAVPRMLPYQSAVLPFFPVPNAHVPTSDYGYTKDQLAIGIRMIASINPYDTFHPTGGNDHQCIDKLHDDRPDWTVSDVCPDLVPGLLCSWCNAEGLMVANFLLARMDTVGVATIDTVPGDTLKRLAASFLTGGNQIPFEHFLWRFAGSGYGSNETINVTQVRAWNVLKRQRYFDKLKTWSPGVLTKGALEAQHQATIGHSMA